MGVYKHLRGGTCIAVKGQSLLYQSTASSIRTRRALVPVSVIIVLVRVLNQTKVAGGGKGIVKHQHPLGLNNILNGLHAVSVEEVQLALLVVVSRLLDLLRTVRIPDVIGLFFISGIATLVLAHQHVDLSLAFGAEEIEELLYSTVAMSVGVGGRRRKKNPRDGSVPCRCPSQLSKPGSGPDCSAIGLPGVRLTALSPGRVSPNLRRPLHPGDRRHHHPRKEAALRLPRELVIRLRLVERCQIS